MLRTIYSLARLIFFLIFFPSAIDAQILQMEFFDSTTTSVRFTDSKIDNDGNVISVAFDKSGYDRILVKTDLKGNVVWKRRYPANAPSKIKIANNGDYLITSGDNEMLISRIAPSGTTVWAKFASFFKNKDMIVTDIAELGNGDIAICGYNNFEYWGASVYNMDGMITVLSGVDGTPKWQRANITPLVVGGPHDNWFTGMVGSGNNIFIAGHRGGGASINNFLLTLDTSGNILSSQYFFGCVTANNDTLISGNLCEIHWLQNKIVTTGLYRRKSDLREVVHVSVYDSSAKQLTGSVYGLANYAKLNLPRVKVVDTVTHLVMMNPTTNWNVVAKVANGNLQFAKRIRSDSSKQFFAIDIAGDTTVLCGMHDKGGYLAFLTDTVGTANSCAVDDTILSQTSYVQPLSAGPTFIVNDEPLSTVTDWYEMSDTILQSKYLCQPPLNIPEKYSDKVIHVYPNPTPDLIAIEHLPAEAIYTLCNSVGQVLQKGKLTSGKNSINLMHLSGGIYYFEITGGKMKYRTKIIRL